MLALAEFIFEIVPLPLTNVHVPVPNVGAVAFMLYCVSQMEASAPAIAGDNAGKIVIRTISLFAGQGAFETVHTQVTVPEMSPFKLQLAEDAFPKLPLPAVIDQRPVPTSGATALNKVLLSHIVLSLPAKAAEGLLTLFTMIVSTVAGHPKLFVSVHISVLFPFCKLATVVF